MVKIITIPCYTTGSESIQRVGGNVSAGTLAISYFTLFFGSRFEKIFLEKPHFLVGRLHKSIGILKLLIKS